jgi:hypothetical protein
VPLYLLKDERTRRRGSPHIAAGGSFLPGLRGAAPVRYLPVVGADALDDFGTGVCGSRLAAHIVLVVSKRDALGSGPRAQKLFVPVLALGLGVGVAKRVLKNTTGMDETRDTAGQRKSLLYNKSRPPLSPGSCNQDHRDRRP